MYTAIYFVKLYDDCHDGQTEWNLKMSVSSLYSAHDTRELRLNSSLVGLYQRLSSAQFSARQGVIGLWNPPLIVELHRPPSPKAPSGSLSAHSNSTRPGAPTTNTTHPKRLIPIA